MSAMHKNKLLPAIALLGGAVGFALRKWELATAFEPGTGLPISGMPATITLAVWSAAIAAALFLLCRDCKERLPYDRAFAAEGNSLYLTAAVLSAFLLLASAGAEIVTFPITYQAALSAESSGSRLALTLPPLRIGLCVLGFLCVLMIAGNLYRAKGRGKESLPLLGLCLLFCVWLISDYQGRAADPVILDYVYEVFAIISSLLGIYFIAGYSFQTGKPRRTILLSLLGVFFSMVTMADRHSLADLLRYGFAVVFLTAHAVLLLSEHPAGELPAETEEPEHA